MGVRRERVILELQDDFTTPMARAAAATALLDKNLDRLDGSAVGTSRSVAETTKATKEYSLQAAIADEKAARLKSSLRDQARAAVDAQMGLDRVSEAAVRSNASMDRTANLVDRTSGRLRLLGEAVLTLGPGLVPLGAAATAGIGGLAVIFGTATVGALGLVGAVQGVGDALKAVQKARLDPTVENLQAAREAMEGIAPEAREWVRRVQEVLPVLRRIRDAGAAGLFPGLTESIDDFERLEPILTRFMSQVGEAGGTEVADIADSLDSKRWRPFLQFLADEAPDAIAAVSQLVGDLAHGAGQMWMALDPGNDQLVDWLLDVGDAFDDWASSKQGRDDIRGFLAYATENGPKVADFFSAAADAVTQLVEAAAPLGGPTLEILTAVLNVVADLADSDLATPVLAGVAAYSALNRVLLITEATQAKLMGSATATGGLAARGGLFGAISTGATTARTGVRQLGRDVRTMGTIWATAGAQSQRETMRMNEALGRTRSTLAGFGKGAAVLGGLAVAASGAADGVGLTNTASLALMGTMGGPWGAAIGGAIGLILDAKAAEDEWEQSIKAVDQAIKSQDIEAMRDQLRGMKEDLEFRDSDPGEVFSSLGSVISNIKSDFADVFSGDYLGDQHIDDDVAAINRLDAAIAYTKQMSAKGWDTSGLELFYEGLGYTADEAHDAAMGVAEFRREVQRALGILGQMEAMDAFEAAIDDARKSFKEFGDTLDNNTNAGRENRAALRDIARTALEASEGLKGLDRVHFLRNAAEQFVHMATMMGMGERAARRLAARLFVLDGINANPRVDVDDKEGRAKVKQLMRELGLLNGKVAHPSVALLYQQFLRGKFTVEQMMRFLNGLKANPHVGADTSEAVTKIHGVISLLSSVRDKVVHITTVFERHNIDLREADGGYIAGPGTATSDSIPAMLSNGEYVIKAAAVDKYGIGTFDRLNAMRYADGGPVGANEIINTRSNSVDRDARDAAHGLKALRKELRETEKQLEKERRQRDAVLEKMKQVDSAVQSGIRSDLFGGDVWSGDTSGSGILRGDIREGRQLEQAIKTLKDKGLTGGALAEVLSQGGLAGAQAYAAMSRQELREFSRLFTLRNRVLRSVGDLAGNAAYGAQMRQEQREYRELKQEVVRLRHAVERNGKNDRKDHKDNRDSQRRGAGSGARNRRRD